MQPIYRPKSPQQTLLAQFSARCEQAFGVKFADYAQLHAWSVANPAQFWGFLWRDSALIGEGVDEPSAKFGASMMDTQWFPNLRLNYAENLLAGVREFSDAVVFYGEDGTTLRYSGAQFESRVLRAAQLLSDLGVVAGDRVAGYVPNHPDALVMALASATLGAVWTSASPDFGENGIVDRFGQTEPKVLVCADGYFYAGKVFDCIAKVNAVLKRVPSIEQVIVFNYAGSTSNIDGDCGVHFLDSAIETLAPYPSYTRVAFDAPLFILYSSGTTGAPKCIVHGTGRTLLQHVKEHRLQTDIHPGERLMYFTTCGWMMWNWQISASASGAKLVLYDGSPFYPSPTRLFDIAEQEGVQHFGTSAKFIDACAKEGLVPKTSHDLSRLRSILSTGSPLVRESFEYVYRAIKSDLHLASISGGTDIVACFVLGIPTQPVYAGEIQGPGLGMDVRIVDDNGVEVEAGEKGELACATPFISMPVGFWNDHDASRYRAAYFEQSDNLWRHGDYLTQTAHGGYVILGRSDAVLNPGGVRIGTAEIYRQVEAFDEVLESIVVGRQTPDDVQVVLFVKLRNPNTLDSSLIQRIKARIRQQTTPRHVPAYILEVEDIPRTRSGKIVELAVRNVIHGEAVKNIEALANPQALELFKNRPELQ